MLIKNSLASEFFEEFEGRTDWREEVVPLRRSDSLTVAILEAQIVVEHYLVELLRVISEEYRERSAKRDLTFHRQIRLFHATISALFPDDPDFQTFLDEFTEALDGLRLMRNRVAHTLEATGLDEQVAEIGEFLSSDYYDIRGTDFPSRDPIEVLRGFERDAMIQCKALAGMYDRFGESLAKTDDAASPTSPA